MRAAMELELEAREAVESVADIDTVWRRKARHVRERLEATPASGPGAAP